MSNTRKPLWEPTPSRIKTSHINRFIAHLNKKYKTNKQILKINSSAKLYDWSISNTNQFWSSIWDYCGIIASKKGRTVLSNKNQMPGANWFPESRLNYAENLLKLRSNK
ncbi:MAG: acetoacetate--CoA ligase, partial [Betaproteobacteria bacterium]|nr:acetoacetate--CoA ligase [Betaproteobacteria bacterium]